MSTNGLIPQPWPLATSVLGVRNLRIRPHGATQKAHLVLRRVTRDDIDSELSDEEGGPIYFSFFAKKRIECKPGKEIFVSLNTSEFEDDRFGEKCVIFEADAMGDSEEGEARSKVIPMRIKRKQQKNILEEKSPIEVDSPPLPPTKSYASIGTQTEPEPSPRVQPRFSDTSKQIDPTLETRGLHNDLSNTFIGDRTEKDAISLMSTLSVKDDSKNGYGTRSAPIFVKGETFPATFGSHSPSKPIPSPTRSQKQNGISVSQGVQRDRSLTPMSIGSSIHSPVYSPGPSQIASPVRNVTKRSRSPTPIDLTSAFSGSRPYSPIPNEADTGDRPSMHHEQSVQPSGFASVDSLASTPSVALKRELMSPNLWNLPELPPEPSFPPPPPHQETAPIRIPFSDGMLVYPTSSLPPSTDAPVPPSSDVSSPSTLFHSTFTPVPHEEPQPPSSKPQSKGSLGTRPKGRFARISLPTRGSNSAATHPYNPLLDLSHESVNEPTSPQVQMNNGMLQSPTSVGESSRRPTESGAVQRSENGSARGSHPSDRAPSVVLINPSSSFTFTAGLAKLPPRPEPIPIPLPTSYRGIKREREPSIELIERPSVRRRQLPDKAILKPSRVYSVYPDRRGNERPAVLEMRLNKNGTRLAMTCSDDTIRIWDGRGSGPIRRHHHRTKIIGMEWALGKQSVLFLDCNAMVCQYTQMDPNVNESWEVFDILDVSEYCTTGDERLCFAYHPSLKRIAVGFADSGLVVWEQADTCWVRLLCVRQENLNVVKFVPNGSVILCGTTTGDLLSLYPDARIPAFTRITSLHSKIGGIDLDFTGDTVLVTTIDGAASLYHIGGTRHGEFITRVKCSSFSPDAMVSFDGIFISRDVIVHGGEEGCALIWDLDKTSSAGMKGDPIWGLDHPDYGDEVRSVLYYRGGKNGYIVSGTRRGKLMWWNYAGE